MKRKQSPYSSLDSDSCSCLLDVDFPASQPMPTRRRNLDIEWKKLSEQYDTSPVVENVKKGICKTYLYDGDQGGTVPNTEKKKFARKRHKPGYSKV